MGDYRINLILKKKCQVLDKQLEVDAYISLVTLPNYVTKFMIVTRGQERDGDSGDGFTTLQI